MDIVSLDLENDMHMQTYTASEAKQHFGHLMDAARQHPVKIQKQGRPFVVVLSEETFEALEDAYWILQAKEASEEGFVGVEESTAILNQLRKKNLNNAAKSQL